MKSVYEINVDKDVGQTIGNHKSLVANCTVCESNSHKHIKWNPFSGGQLHFRRN